MNINITSIKLAQPEGLGPAASRTDDASGRVLVQALQSCGARVTSHPVAHLASLAQSSTPQPDIVVLHMLGQTKLPSDLQRLTHQHPSTGVLLVASALDQSLMREAMRARVVECVTEPVDQDELQGAIDRIVRQQRPAAPSQVFAFLGAKGGVGTTTLAVNVATSLGTVAPGRTLLIDLHLGSGDAVLYLGAVPKHSVLDALANIERLDAAYLRGLVAKTHAKLDLLASGNGVLHGPVDAERIRTLVESAGRAYPYIVLDVPPPDTSIFILEAIAPVSTITLVVNQELAAVRSAARIATVIRERYPQGRVSVVINRYDRFADIGIDDVERVTRLPVKAHFPGNYRAALEAANTGRPLASLDLSLLPHRSRSKLARAVSRFTRDLVQLGVEDAEPKPRGPSGIFGWSVGKKRKASAVATNVPAITTGTVS